MDKMSLFCINMQDRPRVIAFRRYTPTGVLIFVLQTADIVSRDFVHQLSQMISRLQTNWQSFHWLSWFTFEDGSICAPTRSQFQIHSTKFAANLGNDNEFGIEFKDETRLCHLFAAATSCCDKSLLWRKELSLFLPSCLLPLPSTSSIFRINHSKANRDL